jgi:cell wall-associated NlpC family hydrolase
MITREQAVVTAKSWIDTPYVLRGRVKHGGVDCATFMAEYSIEIGAATHEELPIYKADWFLHTLDKTYLLNLMRSLSISPSLETISNHVIRELRLGDLMLFKHLRRVDNYTHGGVYIGGTKIVHALKPKVCVSDYLQHPLTSGKEVAIFSPWKETA